MLEFWVLFWLTASPYGQDTFCGRIQQFKNKLVDEKIPQFVVLKSSTDALSRYNLLDKDEQSTARIFNGSEFKVTQKIVEAVLMPEPKPKICGDVGSDADICYKYIGHIGKHCGHEAVANTKVEAFCFHKW